MDKIKEFLERVRLTDDEELLVWVDNKVRYCLENLILITNEEKEQIRKTSKEIVVRIAQAQLNKVLKEDLALIDRTCYTYPETGKKLAYIILSLIKEAGYLPVEPVQLEVLGDEEIIIAVCGDCPFEGKHSDEDCHACQRQLKGVSQATITHNEAKGKLYRLRGGKE